MSEEEKKKKAKKPKSKARKIVEWVFTGIFLVLFAVLGIAQIDGMVHKKDHCDQMIRFGYGTFVVKTESMEPLYKKNCAIVTHLDSAKSLYERVTIKHEIVDVTFSDRYTANTEFTQPLYNPELTKRTDATGVPMTHRIREVHYNPNAVGSQPKYTFITAGINTGVASATDSEGRIYQYQAFTEKELLGRVVIGSAFLGGVFSFVSSPLGLLVLLLIPAFYLIITSVIDIFKAYKEPEEATETSGASASSSTGENKGIVELSEEDKKRLKEELLQEMLEKKKGDK